MKHFSSSDTPLTSQLASTITSLQLSSDEFDIRRLADLLAWLHPAAARLGLTNYRDIQTYIAQLVVPALYLLSPTLAPYRLSPMLDFGAGSGAVGLSLACLLPEAEVVLADRRSRVVQFLDLAVSRGGLRNCRSLLADLSAPSPEQQGSCGTVLIRAYGPTTEALRQAVLWTRPEGTIALWHQPPAPDPPDHLTRADTLQTSVPALALTIYRRDT
ncbi:MAG: RsmG family class I SAM-dependent methyltransferase [Armatimonadia bacterium]